MQNLQLFEAFGAKKGDGKKAAVNPLFKNNFIDMATKAFGYKNSGDTLSKVCGENKCEIKVGDDKITCSLLGDYPLTKTKAIDYVKFLVRCEKELNKAPKATKK